VGVKWPGSEFDHSLPSREKNEWSCTSALTVWLHGTDKENFTVPLLYRLTEMLIIAILIKTDRKLCEHAHHINATSVRKHWANTVWC